MSLKTKIHKIVNARARFEELEKRGYLDKMPDEKFLKKYFKIRMGRKLNLENPDGYCAKLQWLKLYDHNPKYTMLADKYEVKQFVKDTIGEQYVVPLYGVWDSFDAIDFDSLPNQFILKCTHDSGSFYVCEDKSKLDIEAAKEKLDPWMHRNYYLQSREWVYKNVKPRILAEKYFPSIGKVDSTEYKLTCFSGRVGVFTICGGIPHSDFCKRTNDNYDRDFKFYPNHYAYYKNSSNPILDKPPIVDRLIELAEKLSAGIPQVRVDFYEVDGQIYFGEFTFYTWSGFLEFNPPEIDKMLGDMLELPEVGVND